MATDAKWNCKNPSRTPPKCHSPELAAVRLPLINFQTEELHTCMWYGLSMSTIPIWTCASTKIPKCLWFINRKDQLIPLQVSICCQWFMIDMTKSQPSCAQEYFTLSTNKTRLHRYFMMYITKTSPHCINVQFEYSWPQKITGFPFWEDVAERQNAT